MEAINKLRSEMDANKSNSYIQYVGQFLIQHLEANSADAEKILSTDKTIAKSLDEMRKAAEKKKTGNFALLTPQEGFETVLKYFGITSAAPAVPVPQIEKKAELPVKEPMPKKSDFNINLEDLL